MRTCPQKQGGFYAPSNCPLFYGTNYLSFPVFVGEYHHTDRMKIEHCSLYCYIGLVSHVTIIENPLVMVEWSSLSEGSDEEKVIRSGHGREGV